MERLLWSIERAILRVKYVLWAIDRVICSIEHVAPRAFVGPCKLMNGCRGTRVFVIGQVAQLFNDKKKTSNRCRGVQGRFFKINQNYVFWKICIPISQNDDF